MKIIQSQSSLFVLKPKPPTKFEIESRRRGAPFEVQGKKWGVARKAKRAKSQTEGDLPKDVLDAIGWKKRGLSEF